MSGPFFGKIECFSNPGSKEGVAQEFFKNIYDFMVYLETQNVVTIRARYNGDGAGTGTDYHDGANPFKSNAFILVEWRTASTSPANPSYAGPRTQPFYSLIQFWRGDQSALGGTNGAPALSNGAASSGGVAGLAMQMAVGVGGDLNPWNGTLVLGSAAKGNPVWKDPGSGGTGHFVFPRSNSPALAGTGGTAAHITSQQNMSQFFLRTGADGAAQRTHLIADYDGFLTLYDRNDNVFFASYHGIYTPRAGLTTSYPYLLMVPSAIPLSMGSGNIYGGYSGNEAQQGGIAYNTFSLPEVRGMMLARYDEVLTNAMQPNRMFASNTFDEMPISVGPFDYYGGYAGVIPMFREVTNVNNLEQSTDLKKLIIGNNTVTANKLIVPWNNAVAPGSGLLRTGTTAVFP